MDPKKRERLDKLMIDLANTLMENFFRSEKVSQLLQRVDEECETQIGALEILINVRKKSLTLGVYTVDPVVEDAIADSDDKQEQPNFKVTTDDKKFAKEMKIRWAEEDIKEVEATLGKESGANNPEQPKHDSANVSIDGTDNRSIDEISLSLKALAKKFNLNSRKIWAGIFNSGRLRNEFGIKFLVDDNLANDSYWLGKIQETINKARRNTRDEEDAKNLLIGLEGLMKVALDSQE